MTLPSHRFLVVAAVAFVMAAIVGVLRLPIQEPRVPPALARTITASLHFALPLPPPPPPPPSEVVDAPILSLSLPEQRAVWHRMILEDRRVLDACIYLRGIGDQSSVPFLIEGLRLNPIEPDGSMIDTRYACLAALEHITGYQLGSSTQAWERWWSHRQATTRGPA